MCFATPETVTVCPRMGTTVGSGTKVRAPRPVAFTIAETRAVMECACRMLSAVEIAWASPWLVGSEALMMRPRRTWILEVRYWR